MRMILMFIIIKSRNCRDNTNQYYLVVAATVRNPITKNDDTNMEYVLVFHFHHGMMAFVMYSLLAKYQ
ncbi:Uncharacterized protein APZ42_012528 [Daphnia magna]|uniref:Uncharacterized protein n=1 Tax=Daphnia magna TaxID=35525 RepID=A0A0P6B6V5_9CRUS|nr:Uncharacterized protein APZ42_012528 [Daphnia magna]